MKNNGSKNLGRPRDESLTPAVMAAARNLVKTHGYSAVSFNMISKESGVARQSLQRRWTSKAELVVDSFLDSFVKTEFSAFLPLEGALRRYLSDLTACLRENAAGIKTLVVEAQADRELQDTFKTRFLDPRRSFMSRILNAAKSRGELSPRINIQVAVSVFHAFLLYNVASGEVMDTTLIDAAIRNITGLGGEDA